MQENIPSKETVGVNLEDEMRDSYLDYSMSVIIGRALPDVRDGLKPVHRRILYAMFKEGLLSSKRYSKCAGVVGEVLKKYHPHGDSAVYDSLVRMAQEWNMRYPLIDGQGNFGCFTGETKIRLADGNSKSFLELINDAKEGKTHFTYTINSPGTISMAPIQAPRLTKSNTPVVRVTLDNGEKILCTPNHRFMLRDGTYREAQFLTASESLMPFYSRFNDANDPNLNGYEEIYNPSDDSWAFAHRVADAFNITQGVYSVSAGRVRHHRDFNKFNNDPRNIIRLQWAEHRRIHQQHLKEMWNDPPFRKKMTGVLSKLWKNPEFREKTIEAIGKESRRRWNNPEFRNKQLEAKRKLWSDPHFRKHFFQKAMKANVLLYGTEKQKASITKAQRAWLKIMWNDPDYISAQKKRMQKLSKKIWANPEHREYISKLAKQRWENPEYLAKRSADSQRNWQRPEYREFHSKRSSEQWKNPTYRAKFEKHLINNGHKTTLSRFLSICKRALENSGGLNSVNYEKERGLSKVKGIVRYDQGLKRFFDGDVAILKQACETHQGRLNHKIVSVEPAGHADVYDLTVDHTHNFALAAGVFVHNSVDGDSAAAYRYTECRLTKLAETLMADIDKETVDFTPNFDDSALEPRILPSRVPNLLINGSDGIAVGMATKIPPHNLTEICTAIIQLIDNPNTALGDLIKTIPGPDFPTSGFIYGRGGIIEAYKTGRGKIIMRAKTEIEAIGKSDDREAIIVTEIPYQTSKAKILENIAELVNDDKIEGISDLRDESDRDGIRMVIELKKGAISSVVLNQLFKHTALQSSFGLIMLSIVQGRPKVLNLKEMLELFLKHRKEVVVRRTAFELREAEKRAHILEGLKIAVENIDDVVALIKKCKSPPEAKLALRDKYSLSDVQAQAILDMRLQRLTGLERDKIIEEHKEVLLLIAKLKEILSSEKLIMGIIKTETLEIKEKFGDARRTQIVESSLEDINVEDLIQKEEMVVTVSHLDYIKRHPVSSYRSQRRGGKGKMGMTTRDEDFVKKIFSANTHDTLLIFTNRGRLHWLKVFEIPEVSRTAKGKPISNLIKLTAEEKIAAILPIEQFSDDRFVLFATKDGTVKKTALSAYSNPRAGGIAAITIKDDELIQVRLTKAGDDCIISTSQGQSIRFDEADIRPMGRTATGVRGINLKKDADHVVGMDVVEPGKSILTISTRGYGKRTDLEEYRKQSRGGSGIITLKVTDKTGLVVSAQQVSDDEDLMIITNQGKIIRQSVKAISVIGRNTQGVRLINVDENEFVVSAALIEPEDDTTESA